MSTERAGTPVTSGECEKAIAMLAGSSNRDVTYLAFLLKETLARADAAEAKAESEWQDRCANYVERDLYDLVLDKIKTAEARIAELEAAPGDAALDELVAWQKQLAAHYRKVAPTSQACLELAERHEKTATAITALRRRVGELERTFAADAERGKSDDYSVCHACDGTGFSPR